MGVVAKQSISNTILLYAGVAIGYLNVTFFFPRVIGADAYGLTRIILSIVFIAQHFAMLGMPSMIMKYFPRFRDKEGRGIIPYGLIILFVGTILVSLILVIFKTDIIAAQREDTVLLEQYYYLGIPILMFVVLNLYLTDLCRVHLKTVLPVFTYEFLFKILTALLLGLTWYFNWSLDTFLLSWAGLYSINAIILLVYLLAKNYITLAWDKGIDKRFVKESMDFSLFSMLAGASNSIISNIDIIMVGLLLSANSLASAGFYAIMVYMGNAMIMPTRALASITSPLVSEYMEQQDVDNLGKIYNRTSLTLMIATGFLFVGIFINLPVLLELMNIPYELAMPVFVLIGFARLIQAATGVNGMIINYSKYYRFTTYFVFGLAFVAIVSNYWLIPIYGLTGAALASLISIAGFELLKWLFVWSKMDLQPLNYRHLIVLLIGIAMIVLNGFLPRLDNVWLDMIYRSSVVSLIALLVILSTNLSPDLKAAVHRGLEVLRLKQK